MTDVVADHHDFSAIDAFDRFHEKRRYDEHEAAISQIKAPLDNERIKIEGEAKAKEIEASGNASASILTAQARRYMMMGVGALALGAGVGIAAYGFSFLYNPPVKLTMVGDQLAINGQVVGDHLTGPKGDTGIGLKGDKGDKGDPGNVSMTSTAQNPDPSVMTPESAPLDSNGNPSWRIPAEGERFKPDNIQKMEVWKYSDKKGRVTSYKSGLITFDSGLSMQDLLPNGEPDTRRTSEVLNGDLGYCTRIHGKNPKTGGPLYQCYALHNGRIITMNHAVDQDSKLSSTSKYDPRSNLLR